MPRIPDFLSQSVAFLYPTKDDARDGIASGGTGFFVSQAGRTFLVTNIHVASKCKFVRIGLTHEEAGCIQIEVGNWHYHPDGDDVAVAPLDIDTDWAVTALPWEDFAATPERSEELNMGVGDEVFMLGRFIPHRPDLPHRPLARFGNIAAMPSKIKDARSLVVDAYLVEMRSISGFSGSPVFVYMGPATYRGNGTMMPFYSETMGLIGIDTGHKQLSGVVYGIDGEKIGSTLLNSGVAIVAPTSKISEAIAAISDQFCGG